MTTGLGRTDPGPCTLDQWHLSTLSPYDPGTTTTGLGDPLHGTRPLSPGLESLVFVRRGELSRPHLESYLKFPSSLDGATEE